ncbi:beta family protein, partial [Serratia marcescens]
MNDVSYVPILKTKRAEFSALNQLNQRVKSKFIPLFEIEPVPLDPETDVPDKTYNEHLNDFGKKLVSPCSEISMIYLDGLLIEEQFISAGDEFPISNAVNQARAHGLHVVPVSSPTRSFNYLRAID